MDQATLTAMNLSASAERGARQAARDSLTDFAVTHMRYEHKMSLNDIQRRLNLSRKQVKAILNLD